MKHKVNLKLFGLSLVVLMLFISQARAIVIEALPSATNVLSGEQFTVELLISGLEQGPLDEVVRAYHLELAFNPLVVAATSVTFSDFVSLGHPLASLFQRSDLSSPGIVMMEEVSLFGDDVLASAQPDSFVLASIAFDTIGLGVSRFDFLPYLNFGIDIKGRGALILPVEEVGASIASVSEPSTLILMSVGLLMLIYKRRGRVD